MKKLTLEECRLVIRAIFHLKKKKKNSKFNSIFLSACAASAAFEFRYWSVTSCKQMSWNDSIFGASLLNKRHYCVLKDDG